jgi:histidinol-phosphate aminotransferase
MEVAENFDFSKLWAYPSENSDSLREVIGSEFGVSSEEVIVGNGSDELLDIASKCFFNPGDKFCSPAPTFGMYKFYARVNMATISEKLLRPDFSLDTDAIIGENAKLTAICQPNNPTANLFDRSDLLRILHESSGIVLVDEAYSDFCGSNMLREVIDAPAGIDVRTMSKAYGLAGLRAGFALARKETIDELRRVRTPFGLNSFTETVAITAIQNRAWVRETVAQMKSEKSYLDNSLKGLGFRTYPSECNFLIAESPIDGPRLVNELRERGVAVRDCNSFPMMKNHIRVTLAPRPLLERLTDEARQIIEGVSR